MISWSILYQLWSSYLKFLFQKDLMCRFVQQARFIRHDVFVIVSSGRYLVSSACILVVKLAFSVIIESLSHYSVQCTHYIPTLIKQDNPQRPHVIFQTFKARPPQIQSLAVSSYEGSWANQCAASQNIDQSGGPMREWERGWGTGMCSNCVVYDIITVIVSCNVLEHRALFRRLFLEQWMWTWYRLLVRHFLSYIFISVPVTCVSVWYLSSNSSFNYLVLAVLSLPFALCP